MANEWWEPTDVRAFGRAGQWRRPRSAPAGTGLLAGHEPATTNLYLHRLGRSVVAARGGTLTGVWPDEQRRDLGRRLVALPLDIEIVPMRSLAFRMAELVVVYRLSTPERELW